MTIKEIFRIFVMFRLLTWVVRVAPASEEERLERILRPYLQDLLVRCESARYKKAA